MRFDEYEFNDEMEQLAWELEEQELLETNDELAYQMESLYEDEYGRTPEQGRQQTGRRPIYNRQASGNRPSGNSAASGRSGYQRQRPQPSGSQSNSSGRRCITIYFGFDKHEIKETVIGLMKLAKRIVASQSSSFPIRAIEVVGYADLTGDASYNQGLGQRRADFTKAKLIEYIEKQRPGASGRVTINPKSVGESQQNPKGDNAANRRVVICWYEGKGKPDPTEQDKDKAACVTINNFCCPTEKQAESTCCPTGSQAPAATQAAIAAASKCLQELAEKMKEQAEPKPQTVCCSCGRKH